LKYSDDHHDAFHLAYLMRLGILPTGYIYPKEQRAVRDMLRRRLSLVRMASTQLISVQSQIWRTNGVRIPSVELRKSIFVPPAMDKYTLQAVHSGLTICRCVDSKHTSNGKKKGEGNAKAGNKYLSWAFSEAAHFAVRFESMAQRFYERKNAKTNGMVAIQAVARKLARATWMMLKHQVPYDAKLMFPG
jgi:transposase